MKQNRWIWLTLLFAVVFLNLYILFLYGTSCMEARGWLYSIRLLLNCLAMAIVFWGWNHPKRLYVSLSIAVYQAGLFSNLFAVLFRHTPAYPWYDVVSACLFVVAILLLAQAFFLITGSKPKATTISFDLIGASLLIAASLTLSFLSELKILVDFIFPTMVIVAASSPAIVLLGYWKRYQNFVMENSMMQFPDE